MDLIKDIMQMKNSSKKYSVPAGIQTHDLYLVGSET